MRGGKRPGAGRKYKYSEKTRCVNVSLPESAVTRLTGWSAATGLSRAELVTKALVFFHRTISTTKSND